MEIKKTYLKGFLLIASMHWAFLIITSLFSNIVGIVVDYEYLPWFRIVTVIVQICLTYRLIVSQKFQSSENNQLIFLSVTASLLFIGSYFKGFFEINPFFCANSLIDGSYDEALNLKKKNEFFSAVVERVILSGAIVYGVFKNKNSP